MNEKQAYGYAMLYNWLRKNYPAEVAQVENKSGLGLDQPPSVDQPAKITDAPWYKQIADSVLAVIPAVAAYKTQREMVKLNIERAKQGLAPIDNAAQVRVGVSSDSKMLIIGGIGLLALVLILTRSRS